MDTAVATAMAVPLQVDMPLRTPREAADMGLMDMNPAMQAEAEMHRGVGVGAGAVGIILGERELGVQARARIGFCGIDMRKPPMPEGLSC